MDRRLAVRWLAATVVVVAVAAASGCSGGSGAARAKTGSSTSTADMSYAKALMPLAAEVLAGVAPTERIIAAVGYPRFGDDFSARDAFVHGEGISAVRGADAKLAALTAPASLDAGRSALVKAAGAMTAAVVALHSMRTTTTYASVSALIDEDGAGKLENAEIAWDAALSDIYAAVRQATPHDFAGSKLPAPVTRTSWIFAADRDCAAAIDVTAKPSVAHPKTTAERTAKVRLAGTLLIRLSRQLRSIPLPAGPSALPLKLSTDVSVFGYEADLIAQLIDAVDQGDAFTADAAGKRLQASATGAMVIAKEFVSAGPSYCGELLEEFFSPSKAGSSSGTIST